MQEPTTNFERINKLQQEIDGIDDSISSKRQIILNSRDDRMNSRVRHDIAGLLEERNELRLQILTLKINKNE